MIAVESLAITTMAHLQTPRVSPRGGRVLHRGLISKRMTFDLVIPEVDRFMPLAPPSTCANLHRNRFIVFKISRLQLCNRQTNEQTNGPVANVDGGEFYTGEETHGAPLVAAAMQQSRETNKRTNGWTWPLRKAPLRRGLNSNNV